MKCVSGNLNVKHSDSPLVSHYSAVMRACNSIKLNHASALYDTGVLATKIVYNCR